MKPIDRILVLTDFSEGATPQVEYAIGLAKAAQARLFLLPTGRASDPESADFSLAGAFANGTSVAYPPAIIRERQAPILALYLTGRAVAYEFILADNRLEVAIRRAINQQAIDLVVVGAEEHATGQVGYPLHCPLIVVPESVTFSKGGRIVVATDYHRVPHTDTFQILVTLANALRTRVDVRHVTPADPELAPQRLITADMIDRLLRHTHHSYYHVESEDVFNGLRAYPDQHQPEATMIAVMSCDHSRGKHGTRSLSKDIFFESQPVFIF